MHEKKRKGIQISAHLTTTRTAGTEARDHCCFNVLFRSPYSLGSVDVNESIIARRKIRRVGKERKRKRKKENKRSDDEGKISIMVLTLSPCKIASEAVQCKN